MLVLYILGMSLVFLEVFVSGFGILGITGIACIIVALVKIGMIHGMLYFILLLGLTLLVIGLLKFFVSRSGLGKKFVLESVSKVEKEFEDEKLVGLEGVVISPLKPYGKVEVGDYTYEVFAEKGYIEEGSLIKITKCCGKNIFVKQI